MNRVRCCAVRRDVDDARRRSTAAVRRWLDWVKLVVQAARSLEIALATQEVARPEAPVIAPVHQRVIARAKPLVLEQPVEQLLPVIAQANRQLMRRRPAQLLPRSRWLAIFLLPPAPVCQHWKDRGPSVLYQAGPVDRKCNRAARCGVRPICDRCRRRRNRRGSAGCDSKRSRSRCRCGDRAQPFPISARDKRQWLLRPFVD